MSPFETNRNSPSHFQAKKEGERPARTGKIGDGARDQYLPSGGNIGYFQKESSTALSRPRTGSCYRTEKERANSFAVTITNINDMLGTRNRAAKNLEELGGTVRSRRP